MIITSDNAKRYKDSRDTEKGIEDSNSAAGFSVTDLGDASRNITHTADVSRSSIAKAEELKKRELQLI